MQILRRDSSWAGTLIFILAALSGCSSAEHSPAGAAQAGRPTVKRSADGSAAALAGMVSAVSTSKSSATIDLKFELKERPVVGKPVDIDIALVPGRELDRVYAVFHATDGITLTQGGNTPYVDHPEVGVPISHTITIVPQRDGIFNVTAVVLADSTAESLTRTFSIPLIAGAGLPDASTSANPAPPGAAAPPGASH